MSVREWMNNNSALVTGAAALLLLIALTVLYFQFASPGGGTLRAIYFKDLETGEMFEQAGGTIAPITAPSGGRGVRAHLYTCGECTPDEWFGYLETFSEEARARYDEEGYVPDMEDEHLVRDLNNGRWVGYFTREGERIIESVYAPCPGDHDESPRVCLP